MGRARRLAWVADGSPWRPARPVDQLARTLRGYGYTVYLLGDEDHLEHDPPEDHTPYSATGWPRPARYGVVYAADIMPPAGSGLPSLQQLGRQLVADRNAGAPGIRWLKYINWEPERDNGGDCWHDSWTPDHTRRPSSDRGHIHVSAATGYEDSTTGDGYDPVARIRGGTTVTAPTAADNAAATWAHPIGSRSLEVAAKPAADWLKAGVVIDRKVDQLAAAVAALRVDLAAATGRPPVDVAQLALELTPTLLAAVTPGMVDQLAAALSDESAEQLVDALAARLARPPAAPGV